MNWIKRMFAHREHDDAFAAAITEAMGGIKEKTEEFVTGVMDFAMEKEMAELRERIERLEAILMPLRNGAPTH